MPGCTADCAELGIAAGRVGVMGDSAGGNLAAVVALDPCAEGGRRAGDVPAPVAQGLVYPAVDARLDSARRGPMRDGFLLTRGGWSTSGRHYLPDPSDWDDPSGVAPAGRRSRRAGPRPWW